jgi:hypothetical protein
MLSSFDLSFTIRSSQSQSHDTIPLNNLAGNIINMPYNIMETDDMDVVGPIFPLINTFQKSYKLQDMYHAFLSPHHFILGG